ncbi:MAG: DUF1788 domain-containing protein [Bacteroidia bacterium]
MKAQNIDIVFEKLYTIFSSQRFLNKEALGGEIPFFIQPFLPDKQVQADRLMPHLIKRLDNANIRVLEINLYQLCMGLLKQQEVLQNALETEHELSKSDFLEALNGPLNVQDEVIPAIKNLMSNSDAQVIFLTGIGAIYPIIRSHTILNNLQSLVKEVPLVMFFPGNYNNYSLTLFAKLKDDNYYRAFNLNEYTI